MKEKTVKEKLNNPFYLSTGIRLGEVANPEDVPSRLEILNTTKIKKDADWELAFSVAQLAQVVENFEKKTLGRDVPVNIDHPRWRGATSEAYGWINQMNLVREHGEGEKARLIANINWNKSGREMIASGAFKYTSIGAYLNYLSHNDGKTRYGMVLFELSLTNDPAFLALPKIGEESLAEFRSFCQNKNHNDLFDGGSEMDKDKEILNLTKKVSEQDLELQRLNKDLAELEKETVALNLSLEKANKELELADRTNKLDKLIVERKISPAQKEKALALSKEEFAGFMTALSMSNTQVSSASSAQLPEGAVAIKAGEGEAGPNSTQENVMELAKKLQDELAGKNVKINLSEAVKRVLKKDPKLHQRFMLERSKLA